MLVETSKALAVVERGVPTTNEITVFQPGTYPQQADVPRAQEPFPRSSRAHCAGHAHRAAHGRAAQHAHHSRRSGRGRHRRHRGGGPALGPLDRRGRPQRARRGQHPGRPGRRSRSSAQPQLQPRPRRRRQPLPPAPRPQPAAAAPPPAAARGPTSPRPAAAKSPPPSSPAGPTARALAQRPSTPPRAAPLAQLFRGCGGADDQAGRGVQNRSKPDRPSRTQATPSRKILTARWRPRSS